MFLSMFRRARTRSAPVAACVATMALAGHAQATWSIILVDTRTGEVAVASATCLTNFDLRDNTPVMIVGVGGLTAQSSVDQRGLNRTFARDRMCEGIDPNDILALLEGFDSAHQSRQYGLVDTQGRAMTFSGENAGQWKGGQTGSFTYTNAGHTGTIVYAVQGNVLAGEPVVAEAIEAIINTPGDVAERLMAGMEAAHLLGGDGRCSCSNSDPDGCGSPPAGFDPPADKSAHIAYMLIGRAGDTNSALSVYRVETPGYGHGFVDLDDDGVLDVVISGNSSLMAMRSAADPDGTMLKLDSAQIIQPIPARAERVAVGDVTGDTIPDIVTGSAAGNAVYVFRGLGGGAFDPAITISVGNDAASIDLADLNGDSALDIITTTNAGNTAVIIPTNGAGGFGPSVFIGAGTNCVGGVTLDYDNDGDLDIAVLQTLVDRVQIILNLGGGAFVLGPTYDVADEPQDAVVGDWDGDGRDDLGVAARTGRAVTILTRSDTGFDRVDVDVVERLVRIAAADVDGDGDTDLAGLRLSGPDFRLLLNDGSGGFAYEGAHRLAGGGADFALVDLTGDGCPDAISASGNQGLSGIANLRDSPIGRFSTELGCANGDYFMNFNIANQSAGDDDPTRQLRNLFDQWRTDLIGRPDAIVSDVQFDAQPLLADGRDAVMTVSLLDWQQNPVIVGASITVEHAPESAGVTTIGAITSLGGGVFNVALGGSITAGTDVFRVTADDGVRPVVLMPTPTLEVVPHPADVDGDGDVDGDDFFTFLDYFATQDDRADIDDDGDIDSDDFFAFLDLFVL
ncbi:MAG: VCBS repeat-containing protein [Phycisphaeraceae bacterium]|nr:VCBS repeat-containing protein [Phycisphaeraceae bacterium]